MVPTLLTFYLNIAIAKSVNVLVVFSILALVQEHYYLVSVLLLVIGKFLLVTFSFMHNFS